MINRNIIENIHSTDLYGTFIECGAGNEISNILLNVPGASNTVFKCVQPYSKEFQKEEYGDFDRSVSKEFCNAVIEKEKLNTLHNEKHNFIFVSTWQVSENSSKITHGWLGINRKDNYNSNVFLHFTMKNTSGFKRHDINKLVADLSLKIISNISNGFTIDKINTEHFILDQAFNNDKPLYDLLFNSLNENSSDYFLSFRNNNPVRFEEILRESEEFVVLKGSFNPIHHQHVKMMEATNKLYPNAKQIYLVSLDRYDKPHIENSEAIEKIQKLNALGHTIIFCKEIYFYNTFKLLYKYDKNFYFPIGFDTMNRIYQTDFEENGCTGTEEYIYSICAFFKKFKLILFPRNNVEITWAVELYNPLVKIIPEELYEDDGTSSTKIRNQEIKNLLDNV